MKVSSNKVVSLTYELKIEDGTEMLLVEKVTTENPFVYLHGLGSLPEKFESELHDRAQGEAFNFMLNKEESGYGEIDPTAVVDLPKDIFMVDGVFDSEMITEGHFIPMTDSDGNKMQGLVLEVAENTIKMDFNHPLAGRNLYFEGSIHDIREASAEELDHGHVHGEGGHHHE